MFRIQTRVFKCSVNKRLNINTIQCSVKQTKLSNAGQLGKGR